MSASALFDFMPGYQPPGEWLPPSSQERDQQSHEQELWDLALRLAATRQNQLGDQRNLQLQTLRQGLDTRNQEVYNRIAAANAALSIAQAKNNLNQTRRNLSMDTPGGGSYVRARQMLGF